MFAAFLIVTLGKERGVIGAQPFKGVVHYSGRKGGLLGLNHVRVWSIIVAGEQSSQSPCVCSQALTITLLMGW